MMQDQKHPNKKYNENAKNGIAILQMNSEKKLADCLGFNQ